MRRTPLALILVAAAVAAFALGGCAKCQEMIGTRTIDNPEEESPEWVLQQVLIAAMDPDTDSGYKKLYPYLHSQLTESRAAESSFRMMNFEAIHRKVKLFLVDDSKPVYEIDYREELDNGELKIFVVNEGSLPTPCSLSRDPKANNNWRVLHRCL
ncbi:MAG: hypothetical protein CSA66_01225 [Proteobacteria bacterium]|nr:MAG: hypothetical protein CSA66_01225 [Pseudomonadota bacterium]